jgi:UDP-glucose 4-epimerase
VESGEANAPRREGDPARIVAASARIRDALGWCPRYDDLSAIVGHALAWERQPMTRRMQGRDAKSA